MAIVLEGFLDDLAAIGGGLAGGAAGALTLNPAGVAVGASLGASAGGSLAAAASSGGSSFSGDWSKMTDEQCEAMARATPFPSQAADIRAKCAAEKAKKKKKGTGNTNVLGFFDSLKAKIEEFNALHLPAFVAAPPPPTPAQLAAKTITSNVQAQLESQIGGKVGGKNSILLKSTNAGAAAPVDRGAVKPADKTSSLPILLGVGVAAVGALYFWHAGQKKRGSKGLW